MTLLSTVLDSCPIQAWTQMRPCKAQITPTSEDSAADGCSNAITRRFQAYDDRETLFPANGYPQAIVIEANQRGTFLKGGTNLLRSANSLQLPFGCLTSHAVIVVGAVGKGLNKWPIYSSLIASTDLRYLCSAVHTYRCALICFASWDSRGQLHQRSHSLVDYMVRWERRKKIFATNRLKISTGCNHDSSFTNPSPIIPLVWMRRTHTPSSSLLCMGNEYLLDQNPAQSDWPEPPGCETLRRVLVITWAPDGNPSRPVKQYVDS